MARKKRRGGGKKIFFIIILIILLIILIFFGRVFFQKEPVKDDLKGKLPNQKPLNVFVNIVGNRPPKIISYYPLNLNFSVNGTDELYHNIVKYDPDGTIPDTIWKVDGFLIQQDLGNSGESFNEFRYLFGCRISGEHNVEAIISDGLSNDSVKWNIQVNLVPCPVNSSIGTNTDSQGGDSGSEDSGINICREKWECNNWSRCEKIDLADNKNINSSFMLIIKQKCRNFNWSYEVCGVQTRNCSDIRNCSTIINKPIVMRECYDISNLGCSDGVLNCHNGSCEVLTDCGGPCGPCTENPEKSEKPSYNKITLYFLIVLVIFVLVLIIILRFLSKKKTKLKI